MAQNSRRMHLVGKTEAAWAAAPTTVLRSYEVGIDTTSGKMRCGDGATAWNDLADLNPGAAELVTLRSELAALVARVSLLENAEPPPPDPATSILRYACVSYIYPGSSGAAEWAVLAANSAAGKLSMVIANPDNGPGYEAKYEPGGSMHTHWTNRLTAFTAALTKNLFYISTNYFDSKTTTGSAQFRGTVGGNWRFTVTAANTVSFWEDGNESTTFAVGASRAMTFPAGFGPVGVKSWASGVANGTTLPTGLALSTSYWLRPTGTTPIQTYNLYTSQAAAIAGGSTGRVSITSGSGGNSGLGPFYMGLRRDSGTDAVSGLVRAVKAITYEMTRCVTLYGSLVHGFFFDESEVDVSGFDSIHAAIVAYRNANHPGLELWFNGTPHSAALANSIDGFMIENTWANIESGAEVIPSYLDGTTVLPSKVWLVAHDDVTSGDITDIVNFAVSENIGHVYINGPSAYAHLPTSGVDGFTQDQVLAAIDLVN